jgi:hypothetical protein
MKRKRPEPTGYHFGHPTYQNFDSDLADDYRFVDTDEPLWPDAYFRRQCPACGLRPTPDGHDPCLGTLPGVRNACCGHGVVPGYIAFADGTVVRGAFTVVQRSTATGEREPAIQIVQRTKGARWKP